MTLHIQLNGRQLFAAPYRPENIAKTARELDEQLPILRQFGRVTVFVNDGNVTHLIVTE